MRKAPRKRPKLDLAVSEALLGGEAARPSEAVSAGVLAGPPLVAPPPAPEERPRLALYCRAAGWEGVYGLVSAGPQQWEYHRSACRARVLPVQMGQLPEAWTHW
jgi:hypothetical protein